MEKVFVVGMGPGGAEYLTPAAADAIRAADILVGAPRHLEPYGGMGKRCLPISGDFKAVAETVARESSNKIVAVLVSGDPGFHSFLRLLTQSLPREQVRVIPGISSIQLAFARLALPWQDAVLVSAHGASADTAVWAAKSGALTVILAGRGMLPAGIAARLLAAGISPHRQAWIAENLSYPDERIIRGTLGELQDSDAGPLSILIVAGEEWADGRE